VHLGPARCIVPPRDASSATRRHRRSHAGASRREGESRAREARGVAASRLCSGVGRAKLQRGGLDRRRHGAAGDAVARRRATHTHTSTPTHTADNYNSVAAASLDAFTTVPPPATASIVGGGVAENPRDVSSSLISSVLSVETTTDSIYRHRHATHGVARDGGRLATRGTNKGRTSSPAEFLNSNVGVMPCTYSTSTPAAAYLDASKLIHRFTSGRWFSCHPEHVRRRADVATSAAHTASTHARTTAVAVRVGAGILNTQQQRGAWTPSHQRHTGRGWVGSTDHWTYR
jgi:hypothetical protein